MSDTARAEEVLTQPVFIAGAYKPFGEFTAAEVAARAAELKSVAGFGPTAKVAPVVRAWGDLARDMTSAQAHTVAELGAEAALRYGERLWVVAPRSGML